jgi:hypothetical protein
VAECEDFDGFVDGDPVDHLLVGLAERCGFGWSGVGTILKVAERSQQDLSGLQIGLGRAVDELGDDRLTLGDLTAPAVLDEDGRLVQRLARQGRQVLRAAN